MNELRPCPFCGANAVLIDWVQLGWDDRGVIVSCAEYCPETHQVRVKWRDVEGATAIWNGRAQDVWSGKIYLDRKDL